ncbi:MAG: pyridoxamine 5'-phosphate oxidase family protein [Gammaproteobacteria bacterium]|nr:pyridoxamine 5'-phosphate oxidase family protein [Gammaproteobacteria bacterium]
MISGAWDAATVEAYLVNTKTPLRLSCQRGSGYPAIASLWYLWRDNSLWCATQKSAAVAKLLKVDPKCGFEVATNTMPYMGVRGFGDAIIHDDIGNDILRELLARYEIAPGSRLSRWLLSRTTPEVAIEIAPGAIQSWDYSDRMRT